MAILYKNGSDFYDWRGWCLCDINSQFLAKVDELSLHISQSQRILEEKEQLLEKEKERLAKGSHIQELRG